MGFGTANFMRHYSERFERNVWITSHAQTALIKRGLDEATQPGLIETREILDKGDGHD